MSVGELEYCFHCGEPTERCGEDSIYSEDGIGPFCEECWDRLKDEILSESTHQQGTFTWAMEKVVEGGKVRRNHWDEEKYIYMNQSGHIVNLIEDTGELFSFCLYDYDIKATDWEVYDE